MQDYQPQIPVGVRQHVHHAYIWLGALSATLTCLAIFAAIGFSVIEEITSTVAANGLVTRNALMIPIMVGLGLFIFLLIMGALFLYQYLSYKHLWYEVGEAEFSLYSGIINKKRVHVPYSKIQSVDFKSPLLLRLFGLCNVSVDTAGGAANKAIQIPYLTNQVASALRNELYARRQIATQSQRVESVANSQSPYPSQQVSGNVLDIGDKAWQEFGGVFSETPIELEPVRFEYGLTTKELMLAGISGTSASSAIWSIIVWVLVIVGLISGGSNFIELGDLDAAFSSIYIGPLFIAFSVFIIAIILIVWIFSIIGTCLLYGGFHARRRGDRIEIEHGLLQHQTYNISVERVQSVMVKQSLLRRLIGYCQISVGRVDAIVANDNTNKNTNVAQDGLVIHPFVKKSQVPSIIQGLLPEYADIPSDEQYLAKVAMRRGIIRQSIIQGSGFWLAIITTLLLFIFRLIFSDPTEEDLIGLAVMDNIYIILYIFSAFLFVQNVVNAILWAKGSCFAFNRKFLKVVNAGFSVKSVEFPRNKIQYASTLSNPFQRMAHTTTLSAVTAATSGAGAAKLVDITREDGDRWLEWIEPKPIENATSSASMVDGQSLN